VQGGCNSFALTWGPEVGRGVLKAGGRGLETFWPRPWGKVVAHLASHGLLLLMDFKRVGCNLRGLRVDVVLCNCYWIAVAELIRSDGGGDVRALEQFLRKAGV